MNMETILHSRSEKLCRIIEAEKVDAVLICQGIRENWDAWLTGSTEIPVLQPFGRLNLFFIFPQGEVEALCAYPNHPCDFPHYPLFRGEDYGDRFPNKRLGLVNPECLLKCTKDDLERQLPGLCYVDVTQQFLAAKANKCPEEQTGVIEAAKIYDRGFALMPWLVREGQTELALTVELRRRFGTLGAEVTFLGEDPGATTLIHLTAAPQDGRSIPEPIPYPGYQLRQGDRVNLCVNGYLKGGFAAALGRCYVLGKATEETQKMWNMTVELQHRAAERLQPGITLGQVMDQLERELRQKDSAVSLGANSIYGIGCSRSEAPRAVDSSRDMKLEKGMTLVVAPKLTLAGKDPYCCMDVYCVTENGGVRLSQTEQTLVELS
jgi:Xaa-Pro aminopeptidase